MQRDPTHTALVQCLLEMGSSWIWSCQPGDTCSQGKESSTLQAATPKPRDSPAPGRPAHRHGSSSHDLQHQSSPKASGYVLPYRKPIPLPSPRSKTPLEVFSPSPGCCPGMNPFPSDHCQGTLVAGSHHARQGECHPLAYFLKSPIISEIILSGVCSHSFCQFTGALCKAPPGGRLLTAETWPCSSPDVPSSPVLSFPKTETNDPNTPNER